MAGSDRLTLELSDEAATARLAARLAGLLAAGDVLTLAGDLGVGKTALARALIRARLGPDVEVPSPTFTLVQTYVWCSAPTVSPVLLWHFDLYRIADPDELVELGWEDARAEGIVLVEWPDRLGPLMPTARLDIGLDFAPGGPERRSARLQAHGMRAQDQLRVLDKRLNLDDAPNETGP